MASSMRGHRSRKFKADINVVPYIDVMLVLLVIFMVAAPLTNPGVINLPTAEKSSLPPSRNQYRKPTCCKNCAACMRAIPSWPS
jgi:biopolymer transport protein ExbD